MLKQGYSVVLNHQVLWLNHRQGGVAGLVAAGVGGEAQIGLLEAFVVVGQD